MGELRHKGLVNPTRRPVRHVLGGKRGRGAVLMRCNRAGLRTSNEKSARLVPGGDEQQHEYCGHNAALQVAASVCQL